MWVIMHGICSVSRIKMLGFENCRENFRVPGDLMMSENALIFVRVDSAL